MNPRGPEIGVLTRARFLGVVGALFVLQVGLILVFAERAGRSAAPIPPRTKFLALDAPVVEDELSKMFFASDPAVFVWPGVHGFSGRAWLSQRPAQIQSSNRLEPPSWLDLDVSKLGRVPPGEAIATALLPPDLIAQSAPQLEPLPVLSPNDAIQTQSVFRVEGDARARWTGETPPMPVWASQQLLTNSLVEIGVNRTGDVTVHRLLARSGSAEADAAALAAAKALRFIPAAGAGTAWGQAVFEWHTSEATNATMSK
jgi:TonB family protein